MTENTEGVIRTRSEEQLETIKETLRFADVDYKVRREFVVEITEPAETVEPVQFPREGTVGHAVLVELADLHPTFMTAEPLADGIGEKKGTVNAECSRMHDHGLLNREREATEMKGPNPYTYQLKEEFVDEILDVAAVSEESSGLAELFG